MTYEEVDFVQKLGIILLISQTLVGVPMLAQESILETTVQTETESVTTETSQTVANLESETTSQTVMQEKNPLRQSPKAVWKCGCSNY